jgi:hypothetical protein
MRPVRCHLLTATLLLVTVLAASAMSVLPPTFDQLVGSADFVVRGVVTDVHCITVETSQGEAIRTLVTLHVEQVLKGSPGTDVTLSFLGGRVGRRTLSVLGMPKFAVGQREIVFVANNGRTICPLIAAGHGRYHVQRDATDGRDYIVRENGLPLTSTDEIAGPLDGAPATPAALPRASAALTLDAFEAKITAAAQAAQPKLLP